MHFLVLNVMLENTRVGIRVDEWNEGREGGVPAYLAKIPGLQTALINIGSHLAFGFPCPGDRLHQLPSQNQIKTVCIDKYHFILQGNLEVQS